MESTEGLFAQLESLFSSGVVGPLAGVLFWDLAFWDNAGADTIQLPIVVVWLVFGAIFFTLRFQFVNFRAFRHAIDCVRGVYSQPGETGEISHFQALSAALSGTVGLGNIAGVAIAVGVGGPGAVFWMTVAGFLGMSSKFAECTLGQKYRIMRPDGHVSGGPMHYLRDGLAELGLPRLGRGLALIFAVMCVGGSIGGGNMFQSNQSYAQVAVVLPFLSGELGATVFGLLLAVLVGLVIFGGIRRIGEVAGLPRACDVFGLRGLRPADPDGARNVDFRGLRRDPEPRLLARGRVRGLPWRADPGLPARSLQQRGGHRRGIDRSLGSAHRGAGARGRCCPCSSPSSTRSSSVR